MSYTLHWELRDYLQELREGGRLNLLIALMLHANNRLRCWPGTDLLLKETGLASATLTKAKKWLIERGALTLVPHEKRVDDECALPSAKQVYQLTGVMKIGNTTKHYLFMTPEAFEATSKTVDEITRDFSPTDKSPTDKSLSETKGIPSSKGGSKSKGKSLPRASRGEFTASKFYLVADEKRVIFIKPYKQADAQAECDRLKEYGVIAIKGSTLNDEAISYASYERRKPQRPRDVTFDAFGEGAFNLPPNFDTSNIGKDGGRIGKLVSQLASHLDRTFNDIVNDTTVAARVKSYYRWRKTDERYKHLSARDPLVFLGEWQDFEVWEKAQSNAPAAKTTTNGKPSGWTAEDDARVERQYAEMNRRLEERKRKLAEGATS